VEVVAVVTQPDKPVGRSGTPAPPPVKLLAQSHGLPVLQPVTLRRPAAAAALRRLEPELGMVAAYGKILPPDVLAVPARGHLNVHASLLPRWRGAWPIGAAILAGDAETGVSIMLLDETMDTGPVLGTRTEPILPDDTTPILERRLARLGADLLVEVLPGYLDGSIVPQPQADTQATYCHVVGKADGLVDWTQSAAAIERQVRALQPWPQAHTTYDGKQLQILKAHVVSAGEADNVLSLTRTVDSTDPQTTRNTPDSAPVALTPGTVVRLGKGAAVITGADLLALDEVQLEGRTPVPVRSFVNGYRGFIGSRLGSR
jgi:methionyl-tRNA formyltransferase